jgi:hypothetical protein
MPHGGGDYHPCSPGANPREWILIFAYLYGTDKGLAWDETRALGGPGAQSPFAMVRVAGAGTAVR